MSGNLAGFDEPTERFHGEVGLPAILAPQSGGQGQSLYCMVRKAENLPLAQCQSPIIEETLAEIHRMPGFHGGYWLRSADDPARVASILFFDNREHANTAHEAAFAIMHKYQPNVGIWVAASGKTSILTMP